MVNSKGPFKRCVIAAGLATAVVCIGSPAHAVPLSTLTAGGTLTCDDKAFSNFAYLNFGDMPVAANVTVTCITDSFGPGIEIDGLFLDAPGGEPSDALLTYRVTSLLGTTITDAHLSGNPSVSGGSGTIVITETFRSDELVGLGATSILDIQPGGPTVLTASIDFPGPQDVVDVTKDILAISQVGVAFVTNVQQTYSQIPSQVPEPATLALLCVRLAGLSFSRRTQ